MRMVEGRESRVEGQRFEVGLRSASDPRPSTLDPRRGVRRSGVTLVELLVTMLIITILAGLILGVASVAGETARKAQTRLTVQRLHKLMMEHYDTYKTRRVLLNPALKSEVEAKIAGSKRGEAITEAKLYALRELMLMEIPDRWSDVLLTSVGNSELPPIYFIARTDLSNIYLRRYKSLIGRTNTISGNTNTTADITNNQSAECLYLVITLATGDGEARSQFGEDSIGDTDGDGAFEFLDSWNRPIEFLRWAPGFDSQVQLYTAGLAALPPAQAAQEVAKDHDPFDMYRRDINAFRLVPLIYSSGGDESSGVNTASDYIAWRKSTQPKVNSSSPYLEPRLTPYELSPVNDLGAFLGSVTGEGSADNVHNHLLELR